MYYFKLYHAYYLPSIRMITPSLLVVLETTPPSGGNENLSFFNFITRLHFQTILLTDFNTTKAQGNENKSRVTGC